LLSPVECIEPANPCAFFSGSGVFAVKNLTDSLKIKETGIFTVKCISTS